jgi:tRNA-binding EMAP/Myf-like protein
MERKLASIRRIKEISPIDGADKIEVVKVDGWQVVVGKDVEYKAGDLVIYCEIDSFLPIREEFEFLRKTSYRKMGGIEGFRLKTIRLRGVISQGLILPLSVLEGGGEMRIGISKQPHGDQLQLGPYDDALIIEEGTDVTEILGIVKFELPIPAQLSGKVKGNFPGFLRRTDEERCLSGDTEVITEDGIKKISEICDTKYKGKVLSHDIISGKDEWNYINSHSIMTNKNDWYEIELNDGTILKATGNHKIWIPDLFCYREVNDLVNDISLLKTEDFQFFKKNDI